MLLLTSRSSVHAYHYFFKLNNIIPSHNFNDIKYTSCLPVQLNGQDLIKSARGVYLTTPFDNGELMNARKADECNEVMLWPFLSRFGMREIANTVTILSFMGEISKGRKAE